MDNIFFDEIKKIVEKKTGRAIDRTDAMNDLGLDSIEFAELLVEIECDYEFEFPIEMLSIEALGDFNDFVELIEKLYSIKTHVENEK